MIKSTDNINQTAQTPVISIEWDKIEMVLELIKIAVDDDKDEIIDKIIEVGEWLFDD